FRRSVVSLAFTAAVIFASSTFSPTVRLDDHAGGATIAESTNSHASADTSCLIPSTPQAALRRRYDVCRAWRASAFRDTALRPRAAFAGDFPRRRLGAFPSFTPARCASLRPSAIACFVDRAP